MAKSKGLIHAEKALYDAKNLLQERIPNPDYLQEASKITGILWAQLLATALQKIGWTPTKFWRKTGLSESAFRAWRDADHEPEPENITVLANFWEDQLTNIALTSKKKQSG